MRPSGSGSVILNSTSAMASRTPSEMMVATSQLSLRLLRRFTEATTEPPSCSVMYSVMYLRPPPWTILRAPSASWASAPRATEAACIISASVSLLPMMGRSASTAPWLMSSWSTSESRDRAVTACSVSIVGFSRRASTIIGTMGRQPDTFALPAAAARPNAATHEAIRLDLATPSCA